MKKYILCCLVIVFTCLTAISRQFEGQVIDSLTREPVPFATVFVVELNTGATTDINGNFILPANITGPIHIQISCIGYQSAIFLLSLSETNNHLFYLSRSHLQLREVVVSSSAVKLQQDNIVAVAQKSMSELNQTSPSNLTEAIANIPGVDNYSTGTGIGKPVIRGLSGNRIVVYAQNVRMENQQWGDEHGLGIGDVGIEHVEVIKGPASLLYGADAIGGVLYFTDERYAPLNSFQSLISTRFLTNTLGTFSDAALKFNKNSFKMNFFGSYSSNADYQLPNKQRVLNTRFNEMNFKTSIGYHIKNWIGNLRYSYLNNFFGITESDTFSVSAARMKMLPFQKTNNHLLSSDNTFFIGKTKLSGTFAYNLNNRGEYENDEESPDLLMTLQSLTYNLKSQSFLLENKLNFISGIQGLFQQNENKGSEILIPNASITDIGGFAVINYMPHIKWSFESGIRFDNRNIITSEMQTTDYYFQKLNKNYSNFNFAAGSSFKTGRYIYRLNLSSGFRAPHTSELLSNGAHEGTLRFEIGENNLKSENATQADISVNYENEHLSFYLDPFYNQIRNYIFLAPSDSVIDQLPVYFYRQTTARLYGGEAGFHWHPHPIDWLHLECNFSSVYATDNSGHALPLMPANKIQSLIKGEFNNRGKIKFENIFIEHIYRFSQNRTASYESTSPDYHVFNAGLVVQINTGYHNLECIAGIKNLLNTRYTDHLSRFKNLGISQSGRHFYLGFKWNFHSSK